MRPRRSRLVSFFLVLGVATAAANPVANTATLTVPGQFPQIQAAIDAASAGDTILVNGGTYGPIVVDKAVSILGDPRPTIDNTATPFQDPVVLPAITLAGSGAGTVRLVNLRTRGATSGSFYTGTNGGVFGGGFAELFIEDCDIEAAEWFLLTGLGRGAPGVSTVVPYVFITRTSVRGGATDIDVCDAAPGLPPGGAGVTAPKSTVVIVDSDVQGGAGAGLCFSLANCPGICPCPTLGGFGGSGVVCDRLFVGGPSNRIAGGLGSDVTCFGGGDFVVVGKQPDGAPIVARESIDLGRDLAGSGPLAIQQSVALIWKPTPLPFLLVSTPTPPVFVGDAGWLFLEPSTLVSVPAAGSFVQATLPNQPSFIGVTVGVQVFDPTRGLTVPYVSTVGP